MQARVAEIEAHSEGLLKERDFYFDSGFFMFKFSDIWILIIG